MRAFFGILGLAGAGFLFSSVTTTGGCSSSGGSTGGGGTTGSGTGTAGTTGSGTGTAGTTGSGGSGGGGGGTAVLGCELSDLAMGDPLIADFAALDGGTPVLPIGGTFTYGSPAPSATVTGGAWHVTLTAPGVDTMNQYLGVGIYFNGNAEGTHCVDATAHLGIQFDISGSVTGTGCSMQYATNDSAHGDAVANPSDKKISGPSGSYAPQATITGLTSAVQTLKFPFMGTGAPTGGSPATAVEKGKLTGVQWQWTVLMGVANMCTVDVTIDNVKFYDS
jgi:hypothetical protein